MKKLLQKTLFVVCFSLLYIGANAQLVMVTPTNSTTNCNGSAAIDSTQFISTSWYWSDSSTIIQQGGMKFENRCEGEYSLNYIDTSGADVNFVFYIGLDTNTNGGGTGNDPCANFDAYINITPTNDTVNCDGILEVMVNGGQAPYTYVWGNSNNTTSTLDMACPGNYNVTVTDNMNCTRTVDTYLIFVGDTTTTGGGTGNDPCANFDAYININPAHDSINCDGRVEAMVNGGHAPFTFTWNNSNVTTSVIDNACPGNYSVTVTDSMNCTQTANAYLDLVTDTTTNGGGTGNDPCANFDAYINVTPVSDSINCDGILEVMVNGGHAPYTYVWDNNSNNTTSTLDMACSGNYTVTVTDSMNCVRSIGAYLNMVGDTTTTGGGTGNDPCANFNAYININPAHDSINCDGSIELVVTGLPVNAQVVYSWDNNALGYMIDNLCPGDYTVTMSDTVNNCNDTMTAYVALATDTTNGGNGAGNNPCANSNLNGNMFFHPVSNVNTCDGEVGVNVSGGVAPYSYQWLNVNSNAQVLDSVCTGDYKVEVKDANNCKREFMIFVGVQIDTTGTTAGTVDPCANANLNGIIQTQFTSDSTTCDGIIKAQGTGGNAPYTYLWNTNSTNFELDSICVGDYQVTITDDNGCSRQLHAFVGFEGTTEVDPCANNNLQGDIHTMPVTNAANCNGSIQVYASGGQSPFTFSWNNGATTPTLHNVCNGNYEVTITDNKGCTTSVSGTVVSDLNAVVDPCLNAFLNVNLTSTKASSIDVCDAEITSSITGGSAPYTYLWNNGETTSSLENICKGMYKVEVKDSNNCRAVSTGYVGFEPAITSESIPLNGYVIPQGVSASGMCDGSASAIVHGGTSPYSFFYSNGSSNASAANLCAGIQYLTIVDANNDSLKLDFIIASPANVVTSNVTSDLTDSTVVDSLFNSAISECDIDFTAIDNITIGSVVIDSVSAEVVWIVEFNDNTTLDVLNTYQILNFTNGVYNFVVQLYCPSKAIGQYVTASERYYVAESSGTLSITDEVFNEVNFNVFPNPFNDVIKIELDETGNTEVIIRDIVGKVVLTKSFNSHTAELDVQKLTKGQYILTLKNEQGIKTVTLVK